MEALKRIANPRLLFHIIGMSGNVLPVILIPLFGMGLVFVMLILSDGNIGAAAFLLILYLFILTSIYKIEYSLYVLLFCVLFFDQFGIPGFDAFTYTADYFLNLKENRYLPYISFGVVNPIELHLVFMALLWFFSLPFKRGKIFHGIPVWPTYIFFLGTFLFSFVYGIKTGDFLVALWEVRALFYLCFLYVFIPQIITTKKQIKTVIWISAICITLKALQAVHRFISLGFTTYGFQALTTHEDPVLMTTIVILTVGLFIYKYSGSDKWWLVLFLIPIAFGFDLGMRRAAIAGMMVSFVSFLIILPGDFQIKLFKKSLPLILLFVVYFGVAWNYSDLPISGPVNSIKNIMVPPDKMVNPEDYWSNLYREFENYNLAVTAQRNPIIGIGFGNKYDMPLNLANIPFPLRDYIPHNEILWYLIKTGGIGFLMFWTFFNSVAFKGTQILYKLKDPFLKAVCSMIVLSIINQMVVSYFDLQLTFYKNMIYMGFLMGLLPALERIATKENEKSPETASSA